MSFTSLLIDTCDVERFTESSRDDFNQPVGTWSKLHDDQACRLMSTHGIEIKKDTEVVISDWKLFIADVDVTEQDRILLDGSYYNILLVKPMQDSSGGHHKELMLQLVT